MRREALLPLPSPDCSQTPCACPLGYVYNVNRGCVHETLRISENSDICVDWSESIYLYFVVLRRCMLLQTLLLEVEGQCTWTLLYMRTNQVTCHPEFPHHVSGTCNSILFPATYLRLCLSRSPPLRHDGDTCKLDPSNCHP